MRNHDGGAMMEVEEPITFESLESGYERNVRKEIPWLRGNLTEKLWQETQSSPENWTTDVLKELKVFESNLLKAMKKNGWDGKEDENEGLQWTFSGALFYSIIVITTIGECDF
ncbi:hypothetical protein B566_EDAN013720 [Ephemera danica]|nr:hypothetical protein B566_EDAN013720 [Ephemera danica]